MSFEAKPLIHQVLREGRNTLTEAEAKTLLSYYEIPVVQEIVVHTTDQAVEEAEALGFPIVLKGLGSKLTHKTERGLVQLSLNSADQVRQAAQTIIENAGADLEGLLVQPMLSGKREFVAGLLHDSLFGPVVMFGLGGVFTEALHDVAFRATPVDEAEAQTMLDEIAAKKLLGEFRGEKAADRQALIRTLVGLSRLAEDLTEVVEVDINPLLVGPDGAVHAVDALVVLGERKLNQTAHPPIAPERIRTFFSPKSIAIVGASAQLGKWGNFLVTNILSGEFPGPVYLVNQKGGEISGQPVYKSLMDIEGPVDLVAVTIPAKYVRDLIPQMQQKGIENLLVVSSDFAEAGEEGKKLELALVKEAEKAGILIVGPNTMGINNPSEKLYLTGSQVQPVPGSTALVAQSGNMGTQLLAFAEDQGIGIRAFCGSGNEAMCTIEDYMEFFAVDEQTRTVLMYVESLKNGPRFLDAVEAVGKNKPVVILKGGRTEAGGKAAASHTGALAADFTVFEAACRQAGVIMVNSPSDLLDLSAGFSSLPLPKGNRVGIVTLGGGWGVVTADLCNEYGLDVPKLDPAIVAHFDKVLPPYWSRGNPLDLVSDINPEIPLAAIEQLLKWDDCDVVINMGIHGQGVFMKKLRANVLKADPKFSHEFADMMMQQYLGFETMYIKRITELMEQYQKPVLGVSLLTDANAQTLYPVEGSPYAGVFFQTPESAVKTIARMLEYQTWQQRRFGSKS